MTGALQSGPGDGEVWQAKVDRRGGDDRGEKKGEEELVQKEDNCLKGERIVRTHVCLWIWHFSMWGNDSKCDLVQILWYFQENMRWAKNTAAEMRARLPVGGGGGKKNTRNLRLLLSSLCLLLLVLLPPLFLLLADFV